MMTTVALRCGELSKQGHDLPAAWIVERGGGLVGEDEGRLSREGAGDGDSSAFPAGELAWPVVEAIGEPDDVEEPSGLVAVVVADPAVEVGLQLELLDRGQ